MAKRGTTLTKKAPGSKKSPKTAKRVAAKYERLAALKKRKPNKAK